MDKPGASWLKLCEGAQRWLELHGSRTTTRPESAGAAIFTQLAGDATCRRDDGNSATEWYKAQTDAPMTSRLFDDAT